MKDQQLITYKIRDAIISLNLIIITSPMNFIFVHHSLNYLSLFFIYATECPSFGNALAQSAGATCMPHKDCLGFECDAEFKWRSQSEKLSIIIKILHMEQKINITVGGHHFAITSNRKLLRDNFKKHCSFLGLFLVCM